MPEDQLRDRGRHELEAIRVPRARGRLPVPGRETGLQGELLALGGEADPGQARTELGHETRRDLRAERPRPHHLTGREVERNRSVRADRAPVEPGLRGDQADAPWAARRHEHDAHPGSAHPRESGPASLRQRAVGAQQRPVEVDGG